MSKYTTEVRYICETYADLDESGDYTDIDDIISEARTQIFGNYPIFDETYRSVLESKILRHYYTREICAESVGLWKLWLNNKMNEIMPYYNKLYQSELLQFNPFYDIDLSTSHARNENGERNKDEERNEVGSNNRKYGGTENTVASNQGTNVDIKNEKITSENEKNGVSSVAGENTKTTDITREQNGTTDKTHKDKYSDTPQGSIQNLDNDTYLTNARIINDNEAGMTKEDNKGTEEAKNNERRTDLNTEKNTQENEGKNTNVSSNTEELNKSNDYAETGNTSNLGTSKGKEDFRSTEAYLENVQGKRGLTSYSELLTQYRKTFLNIDMEIIDKLAPLFFNLW